MNDADTPMAAPRPRWRAALEHALRVLLLAGGVALAGPVEAHEVRVAELLIVHPYAHPTSAGDTKADVYIERIGNRDARADRLVAATSAIAARVVLVRDQEVAAIGIPAQGEVSLVGGSAGRLELRGLKRRLAVGEQFNLTLSFERAGVASVKVFVQPQAVPAAKK